MENNNQNPKKAAPCANAGDAGWKADAQIKFMQFCQDTTDLPLLQCLLQDLIKAIEKEKTKPLDDPFCKELAGYISAFAADLPRKDIPLSLKLATLMEIGDFLSVCREFKGAHSCYDRIIMLDPNWEVGYISKGDAYRHGCCLDLAIEYYKKAVDVNPLRPGPYYTLGLWMRQSGSYAEAKSMFEKYIAFSSPDSRYDTEFREQANIWIRYLEKKMELFGNTLRY